MVVKPGNGGNGERDPRLDLLYRDAARGGPPAHLDAAILAAARRGVGARPRALAARLRGWRVPLSLAAVVVLSVTLVTMIGEEGGHGLVSDMRPLAVPPVEPTKEAPAQSPAADSQRAPAAPEAFSARRDEPAAKAPGERRRMEKEAAAVGPALEDRKAAAAPEADLNRISPLLQEAPRRPAADEPRPQARSGADLGSAAEAGASAAAPSGSAPRRMQAEQALAKKRPPAWHGLEQEPPQKWLERLADLRKQGRTGEANELLAELKRRFPDHPLPSGVE